MKKFACTLLLSSLAYSNPNCQPFFPRGLPLKVDNPRDGHYSSAYNAPAAIAVNRPWNFNFDVAFIYWYYGQDGMDFATVPQDLSSFTNGQVFTQNFVYAPGYKVGMGCNPNFDDWTLNAEYTWLHNSKSTTVSSSDPLSPSSMVPKGTSETFNQAYTNWLLELDMVDMVASRPFYQGKNLTVAPKGGLRALWLMQRINTLFTEPVGDTLTPLRSTARSHSWAVGPTASLHTNWLVWKYCRIEGFAGASLLYTRYTKIKIGQEQPLIGTSVLAQERNLGLLRPVLDMGLGLGSGGYLANNRCFLDLSARYDFLHFWSQNMMRSYASQLANADDDVGSLFLQGLTLTLSCYF